MKTKLLYTVSVILLLSVSCSVEQNDTETLEQEKELKVKSLAKAFKEDIIPSKSFKEFTRNLQTKSSEALTVDEIAQLEQEFLSQQSEEFVELYYYVKELDLSEEELRVIIVEYLSSINKSDNGDTKNESEDCVGSSSEGLDSLFSLILKILCE